MEPTLPIVCVTCSGRGWLIDRPYIDWPHECPHCEGIGGFETWKELADRLGVRTLTLTRIVACKSVRPDLGLRALERLIEAFPASFDDARAA